MIANYEALLNPICKAHGLGEIGHWRRLGHGRNNPSFVINETWVVRFDGLEDRYSQRFAGEALAYEALRALGVPAPAHAIADVSRQIVPVEYMVLSYVHGGAVIDTARQLTPTQSRALAHEVGGILAQIHSVTYTGFGPLFALSQGGLKTWHDFIYNYFTEYATRAQTSGADTDDIIAQMSRWLDALEPRFRHIPYGALAHTDYHFENILQQGGRVTAVVDWEWAVSGDPSWDFHVEDDWDDIGGGHKEAVYAGYTALCPLPADHHERVRLYKALRALDDVVESLENGNIAYHRRALDDLRALCHP